MEVKGELWMEGEEMRGEVAMAGNVLFSARSFSMPLEEEIKIMNEESAQVLKQNQSQCWSY